MRLVHGDRHPQVAWVKRALVASEGYRGRDTDYFTKHLAAAVKRIQRHAGLPTTGEIDEATLRAIDREES